MGFTERKKQEHEFADLMSELYIHCEFPQGIGSRLDFYLPEFEIWVELKQHPTERLHEQLESLPQGSSVLVLCGPESVADFGLFLKEIISRNR